jgi:starch synthase
MPKYHNTWMLDHCFETVYEGHGPIGEHSFRFAVQREKDESLGFPLYVIDIPGRFDRPGVYTDPYSGHGYWDEFERSLCFQIAALEWLNNSSIKPDIVHCHDHHAGLVPFMMTQCFRYDVLKKIPTVFTVHNGEYHGVYDRAKDQLLPAFDRSKAGLLDWNGRLNCMAAGLKCCWKITTVSASYMEELSEQSSGLEWLFQSERAKSIGIVNGIDVDVWNPQTDPFLEDHYTVKNRGKGKALNKEKLCRRFGLDSSHPVISYIGRLAYEKGADLLPDLLQRFLESEQSINFVVLGTGEQSLHERFRQMSQRFIGYFDATLDYNESLAHLIYAGSDFLIMPSRVEPCGLNQMYSMRYGTIPIVRNVGGLKDTVRDMEERGGYGFTFDNFSLHEAVGAVQRAVNLYGDKTKLSAVRKKIMQLDFSWNASAKEYIKLYKNLIS